MVANRSVRRFAPYILISPALIILAVILLYPILYNIYLSLFDWRYINPDVKKLIGLGNYIGLFTEDKLFWSALRVTFIFTAGTLIVEFCMGMIEALLLNRLQTSRRLFTSSVILPYMVARIAVGLTWRLLWAYDYGLINYFVTLLGLDPVTWLSGRVTALIAVMVSEIWRSTPFVTLILLAGLSSLPTEPFESARVDGASYLQMFRHITLPLLLPSITVALIFQTIFKIRVFDIVFILTEGGPKNATLPLGILIYRNYFRYYKGGYSAALGVTILLIGLIISITYIRLIYREVKS
jgi:multiple sugar transport system permease protein